MLYWEIRKTYTVACAKDLGYKNFTRRATTQHNETVNHNWHGIGKPKKKVKAKAQAAMDADQAKAAEVNAKAKAIANETRIEYIRNILADLL